jgi:hypothetical protein
MTSTALLHEFAESRERGTVERGSRITVVVEALAELRRRRDRRQIAPTAGCRRRTA